MNWHQLTTLEELENLNTESNQRPILVFKHSTSCPISAVALSRLKLTWDNEKAENIKPYLLDLIKFRSLSNAVAETFNVQHESPQALLIKEGNCTYHDSHFGISFKDILSKA